MRVIEIIFYVVRSKNKTITGFFRLQLFPGSCDKIEKRRNGNKARHKI